MIEVFKTNVNDVVEASLLINHIRSNFIDYIVNFDLDDCDKILRVKCKRGSIQSSAIIELVKDLGFHAEVLPDETQSGLLSTDEMLYALKIHDN